MALIRQFNAGIEMTLDLVPTDQHGRKLRGLRLHEVPIRDLLSFDLMAIVTEIHQGPQRLAVVIASPVDRSLYDILFLRRLAVSRVAEWCEKRAREVYGQPEAPQ